MAHTHTQTAHSAHLLTAPSVPPPPSFDFICCVTAVHTAHPFPQLYLAFSSQQTIHPSPFVPFPTSFLSWFSRCRCVCVRLCSTEHKKERKQRKMEITYFVQTPKCNNFFSHLRIYNTSVYVLCVFVYVCVQASIFRLCNVTQWNFQMKI